MGDYDFVVYIDEAGDTGLRKIRPDDPHGSTEWFILSAIVIRSSRESEVNDWGRCILSCMRHKPKRGHYLHFRDMIDRDREIACNIMSELPARYFSVCSHKKNMKRYSNPKADSVSGTKSWFYWWISRLLLERITHFLNGKGGGKAKIIFSQNGGLSYAEARSYFDLIMEQEKPYLSYGSICSSVMDPALIVAKPTGKDVGLQLADIVASAFFKAVETYGTSGLDQRFARQLNPRMARPGDKHMAQCAGYGVKLMPNWEKARLSPEQESLFRFYGYPENEWWAPAPAPS